MLEHDFNNVFSVYEAFVFVNIYITEIIGEPLCITDAGSLVSQHYTLLIPVISVLLGEEAIECPASDNALSMMAPIRVKIIIPITTMATTLTTACQSY